MKPTIRRDGWPDLSGMTYAHLAITGVALRPVVPSRADVRMLDELEAQRQAVLSAMGIPAHLLQ